MRTWIACVFLTLLNAPFLHAEEVVYYHTDALGSVAVITDANRNVIERTRYAPYGGTINRPLHDGPGYTGHETDANTGFVYMQQRYYDPMLGRFLSADPSAPDAANTGGNFNRYWYANNNPYRNIDPDGRDCRTSKGMTTCDIMVTGSHIPKKISFPTPRGGLPALLKSSAINEHNYVRSTPHNKSDSAVQQAMINDPTPGPNDKPATPFGTYNDASPGGGRGLLAEVSAAIFGDDPKSPVMSYSIKDSSGNKWELNVTMPGHGLHFGYVLRGSVDHKAMSIGEGWAWKQMDIVPGAEYVDDVWNAQNQQNIDEAH
ncbi:wall-associated protein [Mizugakiibacter sediminis]|uniref:Wall-associated protein n=2 Tax=Mizugakiibacter sediminis TaxID=1475481 RepID=A0A0K8QKE5_9GAMM|nr:RHS repeat-associated core domain-containing protein [Mizugakiibacter sediminis]GAP64962.1 wall-associated protein [Mizugakiibacter sediminis]